MNQEQAIEEAKKRGLKWVAMDEDGEWFGYEVSPKGEWHHRIPLGWLSYEHSMDLTLAEVK